MKIKVMSKICEIHKIALIFDGSKNGWVCPKCNQEAINKSYE